MKRNLILALTLGLLVVACSPENDVGGGAVSNADNGSEASIPSNEPQGETALGTEMTGDPDTLIIMESADVPTLDPGAVFDSSSSRVVQNMYETLVAYPADSLSEYEPLLAESWQASDDGLEYRFKLREGVTFHSGNPFTCADVEYTFQRNLVTNSADAGAWYIAEPLLGTRDNAETDPSITWERIDKAVECNGEELVLTLAQPEPFLLARLTYPGQAIVDSEHAKALGEWDGSEATWQDWVSKDLAGSELANSPSGTGPYELVSADSNALSFRRFESYWGEQPPIVNVVRQLVPEQSSRIQAFLGGDTDIADLGSREIIESQVAGQPNVKVVDDIPSIVAYSFAMNQDVTGSQNIGSGTWGDGIPTDFFADKDMRLCFVQAFDYDAYTEQVFLGKAERRNTLMPPQLTGYDSSIPNPSMNLEDAEAHCRAAHGGEAWEQGFTLNAAYREGSVQMQTALEILKMNIEAMNPKFKVNIIGKQWSDLISPSNIEPMGYAGWGSGYADPDNFFRPFYHKEGLHARKTNIDDPQLNEWIDEARLADDTRKSELYSQVARRAADEGLYIILPIGTGIQAYHDDLQGVEVGDYNVISGLFWKNLSKGGAAQ